MSQPDKFYAYYCREKLGEFPSVDEAKSTVYNHPKYKKSLFTKKGFASSRNPNRDESFTIFDNVNVMGGWYIR